MAEIRKDYYDGSYDQEQPCAGVQWRAMIFKASEDYLISKVRLYAYRAGDCGNVTVSIRASNGTVPVGADLVSKTITIADIPLGNGNEDWVSFAFTVPYQLTNNTNYAIVARAPSGVYSSKVFWWWLQRQDPYPDGGFAYSADSGSSWDYNDTFDFKFETYTPFYPDTPVTYPTDVLIQKTNIPLNFDVDTLLEKTLEVSYNIDSIYSSGPTRSYPSDIQLLKQILVNYDLDMLLQEGYSLSYNTDLLVAKTNLSTNHNIDVLIKRELFHYLYVDLALVKQGLTLTMPIDTLLSIGLALSLPIDMWLTGVHNLPYNMDVHLHDGIPKPYDVDMYLERESDIKLKYYSIGKRKMNFKISRNPKLEVN